VKVTSQWQERAKRLLALAAIITLVPLPVLAAEGTQSAPVTPDLRASMARVVANQVLKSTDNAPVVQARVPEAKSAAFFNDRVGSARSEQGTTPERSGQFFKTGPGIAVLAVFAAGVGYALYSSQHDRVHSPGKQ
jgi:hypothetical protein